MAVRSRRLFGPLFLPSNLAAVFTVPAGRTAIIRTLILVNAGATTPSCSLKLNGASLRLTENFTFPAASRIVLEHWLALNPGDELWGVATNAANTVYISGYGSLLEGAPS